MRNSLVSFNFNAQFVFAFFVFWNQKCQTYSLWARFSLWQCLNRSLSQLSSIKKDVISKIFKYLVKYVLLAWFQSEVDQSCDWHQFQWARSAHFWEIFVTITTKKEALESIYRKRWSFSSSHLTKLNLNFFPLQIYSCINPNGF